MAASPEQFTHALSDPTRLRILMLLNRCAELCVCELIEALEIVQPKISRHLAILRNREIVLDHRRGLWIYYRLHPDLPAWAGDTISALARGSSDKQPFLQDQQRLSRMQRQSAANCG